MSCFVMILTGINILVVKVKCVVFNFEELTTINTVAENQDVHKIQISIVLQIIRNVAKC